MEYSLKHWVDNPLMWKIINALAAIIVVQLIFRLIRNWLANYIKDSDSLYRAKKFVAFIGYFLTIIILASIFSENLRGLTVALGIAGAGIAFALQEVIASIAGWIAITFGYFFRVGNRVQLGGIKGDVIDIGILRTTLMECGEWIKADLYNGRIVRVANSFVFKEPVFNYSADFPFLWDEITIPITYNSDYVLMRKTLLSIADEIVGDYVTFAKETWKEMVKKYRIENASVDPLVTITFDENWIECTLRYVVDYKLRRVTKDKIFMRILDEVKKTEKKLSIASASADIRILRTPVFDINLNKDIDESSN